MTTTEYKPQEQEATWNDADFVHIGMFTIRGELSYPKSSIALCGYDTGFKPRWKKREYPGNCPNVCPIYAPSVPHWRHTGHDPH